MTGDDADVEALRRRLYLPGATQQDRDAFAQAAARRRAEQPPAAPRAVTTEDGTAAGDGRPAASGAPAVTRRAVPVPRRRVVVAIAAGAAVIAGGAAVSALQPRTTGPRLRAPIVLPLTAADRLELLTNLANGGAAGVGAYLVTHRTPPGLSGATSFTTAELDGRGSATLAIDPDGYVPDSGRATVLVVVDRSGSVSWTASRLGTAGSPAVRLIPLASRGGEQTAGSLTTATFRYAVGRKPIRLAVTVPDGARWGAAVVLSD